ncbi:hypothetical protein ACTZWW_03115 [Salinarimonas sp. NSM]|uniref:hypothetical protein n=1 Tax=Salinarimonas sp. NSM TaxID=3458003 RepID=UPI004035DFAF
MTNTPLAPYDDGPADPLQDLAELRSRLAVLDAERMHLEFEAISLEIAEEGCAREAEATTGVRVMRRPDARLEIVLAADEDLGLDDLDEVALATEDGIEIATEDGARIIADA